jgi:hypothetical protein
VWFERGGCVALDAQDKCTTVIFEELRRDDPLSALLLTEHDFRFQLCERVRFGVLKCLRRDSNGALNASRLGLI